MTDVTVDERCTLCGSPVDPSQSSRLSSILGHEPSSTTVASALTALLAPLNREIVAKSTVICQGCYRLVQHADRLRVQLAKLTSQIVKALDVMKHLQQTGEADEKEEKSGKVAGLAETRARKIRRRVRVALEGNQNYIPLHKGVEHSKDPGKHQAPVSEIVNIQITNSAGQMIYVNLNKLPAAKSPLLQEEHTGQPASCPSVPLPESSTISQNNDVADKVSPTISKNIDVADKVTPPEPESGSIKDPPPSYIRQDETSQCGVCDEQFHTRVTCRAHLRSVHKAKKSYGCVLCPLFFMLRTDLARHEDSVHAESDLRPYGCGECSLTFPTPRLLAGHKMEVHSHDLPCGRCNRRFRRQEDLEAHQRVHSGHRPYTCNRCHKSFTKQIVWRSHLKTHTRRPRPYQCADCSKSFLSELHLSKHAEKHKRPTLDCQHCPRVFTSKAYFEKHQLVHTTDNPNTCPVCRRVFLRKSGLDAHLRTHTGERPYICEHCGTGFSLRSNLQSHVSDVHEKQRPFPCDICNKAFKRAHVLRKHKESVHRGGVPLRCDVCYAPFAGEVQLRAHRRRAHWVPRRHQCPICGARLATRAQWTGHVFLHTNRRPFECVVCSAGFMQKLELEGHMQRTEHGTGPEDFVTNEIVLDLHDPTLVHIRTLRPPARDAVTWSDPDDPVSGHGRSEVTRSAGTEEGDLRVEELDLEDRNLAELGTVARKSDGGQFTAEDAPGYDRGELLSDSAPEAASGSPTVGWYVQEGDGEMISPGLEPPLQQAILDMDEPADRH